MTAPELLPVHLLQLPVQVWARVQQQTDELLREFALAAASTDDAHHVPARLTALIDQLNSDFDGVSSAQELQLFAAAAAGDEVIDDLEFALPPQAAPACIVLGNMLDEADDYCRAGEHLLTLASSDEVVAFRRWYLVEMVRQIEGQLPVPWPQYDGYWPTEG